MDTNKLSDCERKELNHKKLICQFWNLKSNYILQKMFFNLDRKNLLEIIKPNKTIQKRLNITVNDYKKYTEEFSSIKIEIIPVKNSYGQFINVKNEDYIFFYYHIYFNENKIEIKRNFFLPNDNVTKINISIDYRIQSLEGLFINCKCIDSIIFKRFYRNNIKNMSSMFPYCLSLRNIYIFNCNTINVVDMNNMFLNCSSLEEINFENFKTNNVTNMSFMFSGCSSLKKLNLSNFNTNNVTNMMNMFFNCSSLIELNLSNFNTNNLRDIGGMFS